MGLQEKLDLDQHWKIVDWGKNMEWDTAKGLWDAMVGYFRWTDDHPIKIKKTLLTGKDAGKKMEVEQPRPYSLKALCLHCGISEEYITDVRSTKDPDSDWYIVVSKCMYIIYTQLFELATTGVYNPMFVSKALSMDKESEPTGSIKVEVVTGLPTLSRSEDEILEKLESEIKLGEIRDL